MFTMLKKKSNDKIVEFNACKQKILESENMELTLSIKKALRYINIPVNKLSGLNEKD